MKNIITPETILQRFIANTKNPTEFFTLTEDFSIELKNALKELYDFVKEEESPKYKARALKQLITNNFDLEQIWQQLELQNENFIDSTIVDVSKLLVSKDDLIFRTIAEQLASDKTDTNSVVNEDDNLDFLSDHESLEENGHDTDGSISSRNSAKQNTNERKSIVDDDHFKLSDMEKFLENEEKPENERLLDEEGDDDEDKESVDLFQESDEEDSDSSAKKARFKDYFVAKEDHNKPRRKTNKLMEELDNESGEDSDQEMEQLEEFKSTLELRQERLKKKIEQLEEEAVNEKPWQLKGEITADNRPQNSLLEEIVEFNLTSRPAPVITEKTSVQLEDIIKYRIKQKVFDSVEKIAKPIETSAVEFKKRLVLDEQKSKLSLAQIYENDYLQQQQEQQQSSASAEVAEEEKEDESHQEIKKLMKNLFSKLDALSNYHFTSTPAIPELKVVSNLPAIAKEEVAPVTSSDATLLAPEEVKKKVKTPIGSTERTSTDKKRQRRRKKRLQKIHSTIKSNNTKSEKPLKKTTKPSKIKRK